MRFLLALLLILSLAPTARADDAADARALYDKGMANFRLEEYDAAIEKWQEGFRTKPVPEFLYNIAQAYRLSKRNEKARSFYQKYLSMAPTAPNRTEVLRHIATLDRAIDAEQKAQNAPPTQPMSRRGTHEIEPSGLPPARPEPEAIAPPETAPPPTVTTAPETTAPRVDVAVSAAPAPVERPVYKKAWFWGVVGGAAAVVVAAVVLGVVLGSGGSSSPTLPALRF